ncbi:MAG TPA: hypothetical protein VJ961_08600, partial [Mariprofundaceae bacterium]|nr:hypothetical protein [Mariprofundaceae bacterium]
MAAVLSQGKGKADQASLFAKLMAIFAKEIKADATAKGPGKADGKGIAAIDAKALLHHLKDQKGKKQAIAGIVSVIDSKGLPDAAHAAVKGKKGEKHAQQMLAAALQHPQVGSAQHNVADDKIGASGKGASQSALTKGVAETVAKGGSAGGEQPAVADKMSALQGKKPSASAQSESNAKQAQSTTGKTDAHLQQSHDAATQASRHLFSDQNGSGVAVRTASGSGDEVNSGSMPTPGHADPKQTVQS